MPDQTTLSISTGLTPRGSRVPSGDGPMRLVLDSTGLFGQEV
ncbi:MAG: hypothetical protein ACRYG8_54520 [Janthinobacterium lividum]